MGARIDFFWFEPLHFCPVAFFWFEASCYFPELQKIKAFALILLLRSSMKRAWWCLRDGQEETTLSNCKADSVLQVVVYCFLQCNWLALCHSAFFTTCWQILTAFTPVDLHGKPLLIPKLQIKCLRLNRNQIKNFTLHRD